jgi:hypothetical protein
MVLHSILSAGDCFDVTGVDDVADYKEMRQAMNVLAFTPAEQEVLPFSLDHYFHNRDEWTHERHAGSQAGIIPHKYNELI